MAILIQRLLEERIQPVCVAQDTKIRDALKLMVKYDYSQLPIVDKHGRLVGMISERSTVRCYLNGNLAPDLSVQTCDHQPTTLLATDEIFGALERLRTTYAVVIVDGEGKPIGIITDYDTTQFFRSVSEDMLYVEDIETALRQRIRAAFPDMHSALKAAFGVDKRNPSEPDKDFDELTFREHGQFIVSSENWVNFGPIFGSKSHFLRMMEQVGAIRNQLMHFRGELRPEQRDNLRQWRRWIDTLPPIQHEAMVELLPETPPLQEPQVIEPDVENKHRPYGALYVWLKQMSKEAAPSLTVSFDELENRIGEALPYSAREHRSWWDDDTARNFQANAWQDAGWRVLDVNMSSGTVIFTRFTEPLIAEFFKDVIQRLNNAWPEDWLTNGVGTSEENISPYGCTFTVLGDTSVTYGWTFNGEKLITSAECTEYTSTAEWVERWRELLERELGAPVQLKTRSVRVIDPAHNIDEVIEEYSLVASRPARITAYPSAVEAAKKWAVETMLKFILGEKQIRPTTPNTYEGGFP